MEGIKKDSFEFYRYSCVLKKDILWTGKNNYDNEGNWINTTLKTNEFNFDTINSPAGNNEDKTGVLKLGNNK